MLYPSLFNGNLFDDFMNFDFPKFPDWDEADRRPLGRRRANIMKTDVHEQDGQYAVDIELPGFKKEDLKIELNNGYLTVSANNNTSKEEKDSKGKVIRQERYTGSAQRSFYVGEDVSEDEIKAKFENGVLELCIPKKDAPKIPEKKTIMIEG